MQKPTLLKQFFNLYGKTLLSVLLLAIAFPPFNLKFFVFVALVPWMLSFYSMSSRKSLKSGFLFGFLFYLIQMAWVLPLVDKWTGNLLLGILPWIFFCLVQGLIFMVMALLFFQCIQKDRILMTPFIWVAFEVLRSYIGHLNFPWGLVATPLWSSPQWIQGASLGTIYFVSFAVVLTNAAVVYLLKLNKMSNKVSRLILSVTFLVFFFMYSAYCYYQNNSQVHRLNSKKIILGQIGVDLAFLSYQERMIQSGSSIKQILETAKIEHPDLIVFPESISLGGDSLPPLMPNFELPDTPMMFGGHRGSTHTYQSTFFYDPSASEKWQYVNKIRLVPFGEYVPCKKYIPFIDKFRLDGPGLEAGKKIEVLKFQDIKIGPLVCFEALFSDLALAQQKNGANLLAVLSNDDWFIDTPAHEQLKAGSVWRAVETGLPLIRVGSQGTTMAVDSFGNILKEAPLKKCLALMIDLQIPKKAKGFPYRFSFVYLSIGVTLFVLIDSFLNRKEKVY